MRRAALTLLLSTVGLLSPLRSFAEANELPLAQQLEQAEKDFVYRGAPINPLALALFLPWESDNTAATKSISLAGTDRDTNQFYAAYTKDKDGWVSVSKNEHDPSSGSTAYRHLGRLANGCHVIEIRQNEGGTGVFTDLLLVKFSLASGFNDSGSEQPNLILSHLGTLTLGDRYGGNVTVESNKITIAPDNDMHHDNPARVITFK